MAVFVSPLVNAGCGTTACPRCGNLCPCVDHLEVDIGVGVQTGEHSWLCEEHGEFGWSYSTGEVVFQDDAPPTPAISAEDMRAFLEDVAALHEARAEVTDLPCTPRYEQSEAAPLFHYVIVRADLPRGIQAANIVHAAGESSPGDLKSGTHAVVLVTKGEHELHEVACKLEAASVGIVRIEEPDMPYDGALMAVGVKPGRKEDLRKHLSSLPLLK